MPPPQEQKKTPQTPPSAIAAPPAPAPVDPSGIPSPHVAWLAQVEERLQKGGWVPAGFDGQGRKLWSHPVKQTKEQYLEFELPNKQGGFDTIKQYVGPAIEWTYDTDRALAILMNDEANAAKVTA